MKLLIPSLVLLSFLGLTVHAQQEMPSEPTQSADKMGSDTARDPAKAKKKKKKKHAKKHASKAT